MSFSNEDYGRRTDLSKLFPQTGPERKPPAKEYFPDFGSNVTVRKANAAFVVLARNSDLPGIMGSIKQMEDRFNKKFKYPYVFLNEDDFSEEFMKYIIPTIGLQWCLILSITEQRQR